jgi:cephalosporin hydroxylase
MRMIRTLYNLLSDETKGRISYYRFYRTIDPSAQAFNKQDRRKEQFDAMLKVLSPVALIETGTYMGDSTIFFAQMGLPVYSFEAVARNYGIASERVRWEKNVTLYKTDSREGLRAILTKQLVEKLDQPLFFYLDAHWFDDLPLSDELDIILERCTQPIIMIDDFRVVDDPGYVFDDYGSNGILDIPYIAKHVLKHKLIMLYPNAPSEQETGARRGNVVLCRQHQAELVLKTSLFRAFDQSYT